MTPFGESLGDVFSDRLWPQWPLMQGEEWSPALNVWEESDKLYLSADLPGFKRDEITVSLEDGLLTISGKKQKKREQEEANYYLRESGYTSFSRGIRLPAEVDLEQVKAKFDDGQLLVEMPQRIKPGGKRIEVK